MMDRLQCGWISFEGTGFQIGDELARCNSGFDSTSSYLRFNDAVCKAFVADDELERCSNQVGIVEFDASSIGSIVP